MSTTVRPTYPSLWLSLFRPSEYRRRADQYSAEIRVIVDEATVRMHRRCAEQAIAELTRDLSPDTRLRKQQALAQWEAHLDSLEDDGVPAIVKGEE